MELDIMSEARKKLNEEENKKLPFESGKEVIDRIRKAKQREILETGKHWIPTADNIPVGQFTTEELKELFRTVVSDIRYSEQIIDRIEVLDLLTGKRHKAKELMERFGIAWR